MKRWVVAFIILILIPLVSASSHYTFDHSEEMRTSGRIDWRDYGPKAFEEAIQENKPIFLMLTAPSWCYWCHVYTSDDYIYNEQVYPTINRDFIPIYVDADKRQDLTRQYLEGGWPSTTIFTPGRERLVGYSGPRPIPNMLDNLRKASLYVNTTSSKKKITYEYEPTPIKIPSVDVFSQIINSFVINFAQIYDREHGGFGTGQKFPQGLTLDFALDMHEVSNNTGLLLIVQHTLENQYTNITQLESNYNLYDPIEGGFHRYGTTRTWTPPHYEKMLYDNVRLLRAYTHLQKIQPDPLVDEVVKKTREYIDTRWYDEKNGGFYGNSDVHGEDEYYGKNPRPTPPPRVEKTKYTDWNAEAIITYLALPDEKAQVQAGESLNFFKDNMVDEFGAFHYIKEDGEKGVQGNLLDNAYMTLAFIEGYEKIGDDDFLDTAVLLANFALDNLYDQKSGGFFERNSKNTDLYAPGENILLHKPVENGIMALALAELFVATGNTTYLDASLKTMGNRIDAIGGLDRGYYYAKSAQYILQNQLLDIKPDITPPDRFWAEELVDDLQKFSESTVGLDKLDANLLVLILVALFAGLLSFASPCTLPILPAFVAYTLKAKRYNIKGMTVSFFAGLALIFTLLGMSASVIGGFLKDNTEIFGSIAGYVLIALGLYIISGRGISGLHIKAHNPTSFLGAFLFGATIAISWTPCVGPILVAILLLASTSTSGGILLFSYAVGLAFPLVLVSHYVRKSDRIWRVLQGRELKFGFFERIITVHSTTLISGLLFVLLGYLMVSGKLYVFNQYVVGTGIQSWLFRIEDWLLNLVN